LDASLVMAVPGLDPRRRLKNLPQWVAFVPSPRIGRSEERPSLDGLCGEKARMRGRPASLAKMVASTPSRFR
jgi:hypothetical protein